MDLFKEYDPKLMEEFNWFLYKINERACIQYGYTTGNYQPLNRNGDHEYGLEYEVDYFHPAITLDDRMRFIATDICEADISLFNKICNTVISHFYGGRNIHYMISGVKGKFIDFERIRDNDTGYLKTIKDNIDTGLSQGKPIWGKTELHTSLQKSSRDFCRIKYGEPNRKFHAVDLIEWVAHEFSAKGKDIGNELYRSHHMKDAYERLKRLPGVGDYYAAHGAAGISLIKEMKFHHDQRFIAAGPGARYTMSRLFPNISKKAHNEAICFLREEADKIGLTDGVVFHPETHNITLKNGEMVFDYPQDSLKYYGTEVLSCQFGIYLQIRNDKKASSARRVSRIQDEDEKINNNLNLLFCS